MKSFTRCLLLSLIGFASVRSFQQLVPTHHISPSLISKSFNPRALRSEGVFLSNVDDSGSKEPDAYKIEGRKTRVKVGYKVVSYGYLVFTALVILRGGLNRLSAFAVSGPLMAAGISYLLLGAAQHDRLSSDTYKRLNLCLSAYGMYSFIVALCMPRFRLLPWIVPSVVAMINSIKGYGYGLKGWTLDPASPVTDIRDGFEANVKTMLKVPENPISVGFLLATIFACTLKLLKLVEIFAFIAKGTPKAEVGVRVMRFAKLSLLTAATYTLKDAADRDRLLGTTFIQLNYMAAGVYGTMAVYHTSNLPMLLGSGACAALTGAVGILSQREKSRSSKAS